MASSAATSSGGPTVSTAQYTRNRCIPVRGAGAPQMALKALSMRISASTANTARVATLTMPNCVARAENSPNLSIRAALALGTNVSTRNSSTAARTAANSGNAENTR